MDSPSWPIGGGGALRVLLHLARLSNLTPGTGPNPRVNDHRVFRAWNCSVDRNKRGIRRDRRRENA